MIWRYQCVGNVVIHCQEAGGGVWRGSCSEPLSRPTKLIVVAAANSLMSTVTNHKLEEIVFQRYSEHDAHAPSPH